MSRIIKWLLFGVACSLLPLGFEMLRHVTRGTDFTLVDIIGTGELLLISTAIAATGLGELFTAKSKPSGGVLFSGFSSFVLTAISAFWFADISTAQTIDPNSIKDGSLIIIGASMFTTFICFKQTEVPSWKIS